MSSTLRLAAIAVIALLPLSACDHSARVKLQDHILAPQRNNAASQTKQADLEALPLGVTQHDVLDRFGLPKLVHMEGTICSPWDSCTYPASHLVYHTHESATCFVYFTDGKLDRKVTCDPNRQDLILGPGDLDPRTGAKGPEAVAKP